VKATHGATIGRLDQEELFYLSSRGLDKSLAIQLLVRGYFKHVLSNISEKCVKDFLSQEIESNLSDINFQEFLK
jgi:Fe-S cluster assembly protein SufD